MRNVAEAAGRQREGSDKPETDRRGGRSRALGEGRARGEGERRQRQARGKTRGQNQKGKSERGEKVREVEGKGQRDGGGFRPPSPPGALSSTEHLQGR